MEWKNEPQDYLGAECSRQGNSKCKRPEVGLCSACFHVCNCVIQVSLLGACAFGVLQSKVNHGLCISWEAEVVLLTRQCNSVPHLCVCVERAAQISAERKCVSVVAMV